MDSTNSLRPASEASEPWMCAAAAMRLLPSCQSSPAGWIFAATSAFIGLSQVRESAVFSGIPLTERLTERTCGVWVVDLTTGRTVAFLRFEDAVQEIFAVQVLPQVRFPELINEDPKLLSDS